MIVVDLYGASGTAKLLVLSQVILSLQLSFAVFPLVRFTSDRVKMGEFVNPAWLKVLAYLVAVVIAALNVWLLVQTGARCYRDAPEERRSGPSRSAVPMYTRILVPLEHSSYDDAILAHVRALARLCGASLVLIHVADGWAARNMQQLALRETEEMQQDRAYLERCAPS